MAETPKRVVLLGASNLTSALATVVAQARELLGSPLEIFGALGHGRSYGVYSSVLGRGLVGIHESSLWSALAAAPARQTYALLTDIGNDILYEVGHVRLLGWIEACLDRLAALDARTTIAGLPMHSIERIGPLRFRVARSILFPGRTITLERVRAEAAAVDAGLHDLASHHDVPVVEPRAEWYGVDPIHLRRRVWGDAWTAKLAPWLEEGSHSAGGHGVPRALRRQVRWLRPAHYTLFGRHHQRPQPSAKLDDGTTIALY